MYIYNVYNILYDTYTRAVINFGRPLSAGGREEGERGGFEKFVIDERVGKTGTPAATVRTHIRTYRYVPARHPARYALYIHIQYIIYYII